MGGISSRAITLILGLTAIGTSAHAADIAVPGYYPPVPALPPAVYNWTGLYVGGNVGGGLSHDQVTWTTTTVYELAGTTTAMRPAGFLGGGQIGGNYEFASWVVGAEGTFDGTGIAGSSTVAALTPGALQRVNTKQDWIATVTGRVGYAADTLLFYLKGGAAWMHASYRQDAVTFGQTLGEVRSGFVAGAGLEYGMTENLSAKLEYDYFDFGSADYNFFAIPPVGVPVSIKSNTQTVILGLNYSWR